MRPFEPSRAVSLVGRVLVVASLLLTSVARAEEDASWRILPPSDWLSRCSGDCSAMLFGGRSLSSQSVQELVENAPTGDWVWSDSNIFGGAVSRSIASYGNLMSIDLEVGAAQRFKESDASEVWAAAYLRWKSFPWNDWLKTSIGFSTGINYATEISLSERRDNDGDGARLLHYFSPEIAFAVPGYEEIEVVARLHHRSGVFGLFSGVHGGDHYGVLGLRMKF